MLQTEINAPTERCFYLSTSIDLHKISALNSKEEAIDGVTEGLIKLNETVTWKAKHFGVWHKMKVKITEYKKPVYFVDEMINGTFKAMKHTHEFKHKKGGTIMIDKFEFKSPFGILGRIADNLFLINYMENFLKKRNEIIREFAESERWRELLNK